MSIPKLSATQRLKAQAEQSQMMAFVNCIDAIEAGDENKARNEARTVTRYAFMLNPKTRKHFAKP